MKILLILALLTSSALANDNSVIESKFTFDKTKSLIQEFLVGKRMTIYSTIDHQAGAVQSGLELSPNVVFIFGNPRIGTLLMQKDPNVGVELPLKIQVYKVGSDTYVSFKKVSAIKEQYKLRSVNEVSDQISMLYDGLLKKIR